MHNGMAAPHSGPFPLVKLLTIRIKAFCEFAIGCKIGWYQLFNA